MQEIKVFGLLRMQEIKVFGLLRMQEIKVFELLRMQEIKVYGLLRMQEIEVFGLLRMQEIKVCGLLRMQEIKVFGLLRMQEIKVFGLLRMQEIKVFGLLRMQEIKVFGLLRMQEIKVFGLLRMQEIKVFGLLRMQEIKVFRLLRMQEIKVFGLLGMQEIKVFGLLRMQEIEVFGLLRMQEIEVFGLLRMQEIEVFGLLRMQEIEVFGLLRMQEIEVFGLLRMQEIKVFGLLRMQEIKVFELLRMQEIQVFGLLRMQEIKVHQVMVKDRLGDMKSDFIDRMDEYMSSDPSKPVFTDDLKTMVHISETEEDLNMLEKMLKRYESQNSNVTVGQFQFGPIIMRLLHSLGKPEVAYQMFNDEDMTGLFKQVSSYLIMMDMLYETGRYGEVLDLFDQLHERNISYLKYPPDPTTLAFAALYRMDTPEAMETAMTLVKKCHETNKTISNRSMAFAGMLALKQNNPEMVLETLAMKENPRMNYLTNLKVLAYAQLSRFEDVMLILRQALQQNEAIAGKMWTIFPDTLSEIEKAIQGTDNADLKGQFSTAKKALLTGSLVSNITLETFLSNTIFRPKQPRDSFKFRQRSPGENMGYRGRMRGFDSR
ncbi:hypothetical protein ScPMuIL_017692 [Solemya velum]